MCYDIKTKLEAQLKRAKHWGDKAYIEELKKKLSIYGVNDLHHASGFSHPKVLIYKGDAPYNPTPAIWGLIPSWVKDEDQKQLIWNKTINARGESIFEKPSFKNSATSKRCILQVNGFYEHHYFNGEARPYYIYQENEEPFSIAGLWNDWTNKDTGEIINSFTIVTTKANVLMQEIHNNPKLAEPRMPVILSEEDEDMWLNNNAPQLEIQTLIKPSKIKMKAHTVQKLRGKNYYGNIPKVSEKFEYPKLDLFE